MARRLCLIVCFFILTGCATTQKSATPDLEQMQSRIDFLEDEMNSKNQEMGSIQNELRQVKQECLKKVNSSETSSKRAAPQTASVSNVNNSELEEIIKVDGVSADQMQLALKNAGFYQGTVDGKIGLKTKEGIKAFQKANNLTADGIVGRGTWTKLKNYL